MTFQFSTDNSNWDDVYTFTMDVSSSDTRRFQFPVTARYFRVVYTNGAGAQGAFRVQTILHGNSQLTTIHRLVDDTSPDRSAQIIKSAIIAQKAGTGDFVPVQSTSSGNLKTSTQEISDGLDIGAGNAGAETQRVSISTDDVNLSAIKTAVEIMDDWDDGSDHCEVVDPNRGPLVLNYTGAAAIDVDTAIAADWELLSITLHLSAAGTTAEDFTVKLDANDGSAYDTTIFELDLSTDSVTDLVLTPNEDGLPAHFESGDELDIDWPNTETRTYGLRIVYRLI